MFCLFFVYRVSVLHPQDIRDMGPQLESILVGSCVVYGPHDAVSGEFSPFFFILFFVGGVDLIREQTASFMFDFRPNGPPFHGCKALPRVSNAGTIQKYVGFTWDLFQSVIFTWCCI